MADDTATLVRLDETDLVLANGAEDARGRTVVDKNGEELGKVEGLLVDPVERRVRFLELGAGGFLGIGKKTLLVPVDAVTSVDDEVHIDKDREHVAAGPVYDPELKTQRDYFEDVYGYYGFSPYWLPGYIPPRYPYV
ncbi:PRC-barrel domain-containing protein [Actinokineospora sp. HUAS TT18]|uniref:PRC-barrel domain-containing protein n=1 Tax=Actinokineospora sp. HUAS TT18 TaxID=3447451 RepID=UPI003F523871